MTSAPARRPSSVRPRHALLHHAFLGRVHFRVGEAILQRTVELFGEPGADLRQVLRRENRVHADRAVRRRSAFGWKNVPAPYDSPSFCRSRSDTRDDDESPRMKLGDEQRRVVRDRGR